MIIAKITVFQIYLENVRFFKANDTTKNVLEFNFTHFMFYKFFWKTTGSGFSHFLQKQLKIEPRGLRHSICLPRAHNKSSHRRENWSNGLGAIWKNGFSLLTWKRLVIHKKHKSTEMFKIQFHTNHSLYIFLWELYLSLHTHVANFRNTKWTTECSTKCTQRDHSLQP